MEDNIDEMYADLKIQELSLSLITMFLSKDLLFNILSSKLFVDIMTLVPKFLTNCEIQKCK
jgi:hypothetical protein